MGLGRDTIAAAYRAACLTELGALKPGNVHRFADGHRMTVGDFERSAEASAAAIAEHDAPVGRRIRAAIEATRRAVGQNTNLGIVLLAAPLAFAAERAGSADDLEARLRQVLDRLDVADAADAFAAIAAANPAGLGRVAAHDVAAPAAVTLLDAMRSAADRDRIARQYATGFADIFGLGLATLDRVGAPDERAAEAVHLAFLAAFPDSHIMRKHGAAAADAVRLEAVALRAGGSDLDDPTVRERLLGWDADLKRRGLNPGTSADLTVATLFAGRLRRHLAALPQK